MISFQIEKYLYVWIVWELFDEIEKTLTTALLLHAQCDIFCGIFKIIDVQR